MNENRPPQNLEAESSLLGALLVGDERTLDEIHGFLAPEDFYKPAHGHIFSAVQSLESRGEPIDSLTVSSALEKENNLESIGGAEYLAELISSSPSKVSLSACAKMIKEKSLLRAVIKKSNEFIEKARCQDFENIDIFLDQMEAELFKLSQSQTGGSVFPINQLVRQSLDHLESLHGKNLNITGLSSSFEELDNMTSGFQPGELVVIAARPSMGKTALSLNMALNAVLESKSVLFFSIEMAKEQLLIRLLSSLNRIRLSALKVGQISEKDWDLLMEGASRLSTAKFFIDDSSHISPFEIRSRARRIKAQHGLDLIVVDYIQLMSMKRAMDSREREVSEISRLLKSIAKELRVPMVALSQLNRGVENRTNRRPLLSDLRESGSIEQDADVIIMLYRDDYYNANSSQKGKTELIINKQRNGPTGTVVLGWQPEFGRFENNILSDHSPLPDHPL